jgi:hypothetical protein
VLEMMLVLAERRSKHKSSSVEGEPSTAKCRALSVFDYDSPEEARQEKRFMLRNRMCSSRSCA